MGHVTVPIVICNAVARFPSETGSLWQDGSQSCSGSSGSSFSLLLITARCGVCFRRIMFPILTTILSSPGDFYNHTECESDVWIPFHLNVGMCTVQKYRQTSCWFWHLMQLCISWVVHLHDCDSCIIEKDIWSNRFVVFQQDLLQEVKQLKSKVEELEGEKSQYERKLRATKVLIKPTWNTNSKHLYN